MAHPHRAWRGRQAGGDRGRHYGPAWGWCQGDCAAVLVNGEPGIMVWDAYGKPRSVMACTVVDGRIVEILSVIGPKRLAATDLRGRPD
jgi:hypothetical protein